MERRWIIHFAIATVLFFFLLFITTLVMSISSSERAIYNNYVMHPLGLLGLNEAQNVFVESKIIGSHSPSNHNNNNSSPPAARIAYLISGSKGDGERLKRTLLALYHPLNQYILHLDLESSPRERVHVAEYVRTHPIFEKVGNVHMIRKANLVTYRGPTMVSNTLHAAAILLKRSKDWDWFINLSASDYPLVTQDDLLHTFSYLPRDLNFIGYTSNLAWKEQRRIKPIIIDPGLYRLKKSDVFWVTEKRSMPTAFKLFTGSAWMALSRPFVEFMIWGWDNLPRTLLMYHANVISSPEFYFHTLICNSPGFSNTTVNSDLHYISWDNPPKQHPRSLGLKDFRRMVLSNAPFARKFKRGDPVLDKIDRELLGRNKNNITPGEWCVAEGNTDPCSVMGEKTLLRPGPGSKRLRHLIVKLLSRKNFR
ncbi:hypothetical protein KI387_004016, partial [Taxus chinensis]